MSLGQIVLVGMFGTLGVFLAVFGAMQLRKTMRLLRSGVRSTGTVVAHETSQSRDEERGGVTTYYHPVIEFVDASGGKRRVTLETGGGAIEHAEGYPVRILFDREDPNQVRIDSFSDLWLFVVVPLGMGAVLLTIAVAVWVFNVPVKMG